jgi:hypothetical protein
MCILKKLVPNWRYGKRIRTVHAVYSLILLRTSLVRTQNSKIGVKHYQGLRNINWNTQGRISWKRKGFKNWWFLDWDGTNHSSISWFCWPDSSLHIVMNPYHIHMAYWNIRDYFTQSRCRSSRNARTWTQSFRHDLPTIYTRHFWSS